MYKIYTLCSLKTPEGLNYIPTIAPKQPICGSFAIQVAGNNICPHLFCEKQAKCCFIFNENIKY